MAFAGMSGPPAMDIGMYSRDVGCASASVQTGVFETTPTIVSQGGPPSGVDRIAARKEAVRECLVDDGDAFASLNIAPIDPTPAEQPHAHRFNVTAGDCA